ncbi:MAG TPA: hypothetical protein VF438_01175 [Candidatus Paceibacterota bacterium]
MNPQENSKTCCTGCGCGHHAVGAIAVILIGVSFLLATFHVYSEYVNGIIWPILLIIAAAGKLCRCCCK